MTKDHLTLCLEYLPESKQGLFEKYIEGVVTNDKHLGIDYSCLGFLEDYQDIARILSRHTLETIPPFIPGLKFNVYDIGCAGAFQHVFFADANRYIAVDRWNFPEPQFFLPNCEFHRGDFASLCSKIVQEESDRIVNFGIANMSLLYGSDNSIDIALFKRVFRRLFII